MKKIDYFDFMKGEEVTVREILEESREKNFTEFILALDQTDEKVKITIRTRNAKLIKPDVTLFFADEGKDTKGFISWKNGVGPYGIRLS